METGDVRFTLDRLGQLGLHQQGDWFSIVQKLRQESRGLQEPGIGGFYFQELSKGTPKTRMPALLPIRWFTLYY